MCLFQATCPRCCVAAGPQVPGTPVLAMKIGRLPLEGSHIPGSRSVRIDDGQRGCATPTNSGAVAAT